MIRTIFLDAAGTLIEPAEPVAAVYARHFASAGWLIEESAIKKAFHLSFRTLGLPNYPTQGDGDPAEREWWRRLVAETVRQCGMDPVGDAFERCFHALFAHYAAGEAWRVFPEVPEFLAKATAERMRLAVVSNFDRRLHRILEELGLADHFDIIVTSADACCRKPGAGIFQMALERLDVSAAETVHIGDDRVADGEGAASVGVDCYVLNRPTTTLLDAWDWILRKK